MIALSLCFFLLFLSFTTKKVARDILRSTNIIIQLILDLVRSFLSLLLLCFGFRDLHWCFLKTCVYFVSFKHGSVSDKVMNYYFFQEHTRKCLRCLVEFYFWADLNAERYNKFKSIQNLRKFMHSLMRWLFSFKYADDDIRATAAPFMS